MTAERHCWWCGFTAEVDTENPEPHNGLVRDTETSWICTDSKACSQRAYADMVTPGYRRNRGKPEESPAP
jgi:hypothetical protein